MRDLTPNTAGEKAKRSTTPRLILGIEWGGDIGTRFYSDAPLGQADGTSALHAEGRVASWGSISAAITEATTNPVGDVSLELLDADHALLAIINAVEPQRKRAVVYQWFAGLEEGDLLPVLRGIVNHPVAWREAEATLSLDLTDVSSYFQRTVGTIASDELFPNIAAEDVGKVLPLVYGKAKRVPGVFVGGGQATTLWRGMLATDDRFFADRDGFPEGETIQVWVGNELLEGYWHGNTFHITRRGLTIYRGVTTETGANNLEIVDSRLPHTRDNEYRGHVAKVKTPAGSVEQRTIMHSSVETNTIWFSPSFFDKEGWMWVVPKGTPYEIGSYVGPHDAGTPVRRHMEQGFAFIVNDAASQAVDFVEVWGKVTQAFPGPKGRTSLTMDIEGWVRLDPSDYAVNCNDTTTFPDLGYAVTTVTLRLPPTQLKHSYTADRLVAQVRGVESAGDGSGDLYENPADVLKSLANRSLGLVDDEDLDVESFAVAHAKLAYLRFAFAIQEAKDSLDLLADLAVQCRSQCVWEAGRLYLRVLPFATPPAVATLSKSVIAADSLERSHSALDDVVTEYVGAIRETCVADERQLVARDEEAELLYSRRTETMSLWAYQRAGYAQAILEFWLHRRCRIYEDITVETMLTSLELERLDAVELDWPGQFDAGRRAVVMGVDHAAGSGQDGQIDTIRLSLRASVGDDSCETQDEEPVIEDCAETCETECQEPAELFCTSFCDGQCTSWCMLIDTAGCGSEACESGCESDGCESGCESGACEAGSCESDGDIDWCAFGFESGCPSAEDDCASCQVSCIISCMNGGAEGCMTKAEQGCDTCCRTYSCQTCCRVSPASETGCGVETDCDGEETGCGVETDCGGEETGCGADTCQIFCMSTCAVVGCETECESGCETECESGCETECESGCETECESGCETECESGCETSCVSQCELTCEQECELSCQLCNEITVET